MAWWCNLCGQPSHPLFIQQNSNPCSKGQQPVNIARSATLLYLSQFTIRNVMAYLRVWAKLDLGIHLFVLQEGFSDYLYYGNFFLSNFEHQFWPLFKGVSLNWGHILIWHDYTSPNMSIKSIGLFWGWGLSIKNIGSPTAGTFSCFSPQY